MSQLKSQFRNRKHTKYTKHTQTTKGTIRDARHKTRRVGFSGGAFRFPMNPRVIRKFLRDFCLSLAAIRPQMATKNTKLLETAIANGNIAALVGSLQIDPQVASMNLAFMIQTYNNKSYYKFIRKYFRVDIDRPTHTIMKFLTKRDGTSGGDGSGTMIVPRETVEISYKAIALSSLLTFLWYAICLYYTQKSLFQVTDKNLAIQFAKSGYDFMKTCKFSEAKYKPKTKIEAVIQNLFRPFLKTPANIDNFEHVMYTLRHCLENPASGLQDEFVMNIFTNSEIAKLERIYGQKLVAGPESAAATSTPTIIMASTRESAVPLDEPIYEHILPIEATKSTALVALEGPTSVLVPSLLQKDPKYFQHMVKVLSADIQKTKSKRDLENYLEKMENISEEFFVNEILGKKDKDAISGVQSLMDAFSSLENFKEFMGAFMTGDLLQKFALSYAGGASVATVLFIDFKKMIRQMLTNLKTISIVTEAEFYNTLDDSVLIIEYIRASWNFIYIMLVVFFSFSISAFRIYQQSEAKRNARSRQILESAIEATTRS